MKYGVGLTIRTNGRLITNINDRLSGIYKSINTGSEDVGDSSHTLFPDLREFI